MIEQLQAWVDDVEEHDGLIGSNRNPPRRTELANDLFERQSTVMAIIRTFSPTFAAPLAAGPPSRPLFRGSIPAVRYAIGHLRDSEEVARRIGPVGPQLSASSLHHLVWGQASDLLANGHPDLAVQRAATFINAHVQDLVGRRDVSDSGLMQEAFSANPPTQGKPRLRWPGDPSDLTVRSMNDGIRNYSVGCFQAIRNRATHQAGMPEQEALEQLAALSTLARWIDECEVITS